MRILLLVYLEFGIFDSGLKFAEMEDSFGERWDFQQRFADVFEHPVHERIAERIQLVLVLLLEFDVGGRNAGNNRWLFVGKAVGEEIAQEHGNGVFPLGVFSRSPHRDLLD